VDDSKPHSDVQNISHNCQPTYLLSAFASCHYISTPTSGAKTTDLREVSGISYPVAPPRVTWASLTIATGRKGQPPRETASLFGNVIVEKGDEVGHERFAASLGICDCLVEGDGC
jgi:hypothetical protein